MSAHIVLITGANTGLGLEIVRALAKSSIAYTILLAGRSIDKVEVAIKALQTELPDTKSTFEGIQLDVTDDQSIQAAYDIVSSKHDHLDTLINNAGAVFDHQYHEGKISMRDSWNASWDVNVTGAQIVTWTFAPLLVKSRQARLLFLTSGSASLSETETGSAAYLTKSLGRGWPKQNFEFDLTAYRSSKTGLLMMMRQWERILREDHVLIWAIAPGFLATNVSNQGEAGKEKMKEMGAQDPSVGGEFIRDVVEGIRDADHGKAIREGGVQPW